MYHRRLFLARKNGGSLKLRRLSLLLYSKRFLTYFLIFTAFFNWLWCYYIQFPFTKPLIFRHKLFIFRPVCSYYVHLFQPFIWFTSCYCLCFVISNTFKSNARETWCVILVSKSWHILLRITAHSTLRSGRHKTIVHWTMCALAERLSQSEIVLPLRKTCYYSPLAGVF